MVLTVYHVGGVGDDDQCLGHSEQQRFILRQLYCFGQGVGAPYDHGRGPGWGRWNTLVPSGGVSPGSGMPGCRCSGMGSSCVRVRGSDSPGPKCSGEAHSWRGIPGKKRSGEAPGGKDISGAWTCGAEDSHGQGEARQKPGAVKPFPEEAAEPGNARYPSAW